MADGNVWSYVARLGVQVRVPMDPFFSEGNKLSAINRPIYLTIDDVEEFLHRDFREFDCQVPGCKGRFSQLYEFEQHYNAVHRHSCSVCHKSLPSNHLLEIHIQENHDSFFAVVSERKPSYQCFLPTCSSLFWTSDERRDHTISCHNFPPDFRFDFQHHRPRRPYQKKKKASKSAALKSGRSSEDKSLERNGGQDSTSGRKNSTDTADVVIRRKSGKRDSGDRHSRSLPPHKDANRKSINRSLFGESQDDRSDAASVDLMEVDGASFAPLSGSSGKEEENATTQGETVVMRVKRGVRSPSVGQTPTSSNNGTPRRPVSLARMGERRSVHLTGSPVDSPSPLPSPSSALLGLSDRPTSAEAKRPVSVASVASVASSSSSSVRKAVNSPAKTETGSRMAQTPTHTPNRMSMLGVSGPQRSKIPVRSNSCRVPKTLSFGVGVPKGFQRPQRGKHWYQSQQSVNVTSQESDMTDLSSLQQALPQS